MAARGWRLFWGAIAAAMAIYLVWSGRGLSSIAVVVQAQTPTTQGQWSAVQPWPAVAVHAHLLPTGKVLFWPYADEPRLWDPQTGAITAAANSGFNLFCTWPFLSSGWPFVRCRRSHQQQRGVADGSHLRRLREQLDATAKHECRPVVSDDHHAPERRRPRPLGGHRHHRGPKQPAAGLGGGNRAMAGSVERAALDRVVSVHARGAERPVDHDGCRRDHALPRSVGHRKLALRCRLELRIP